MEAVYGVGIDKVAGLVIVFIFVVLIGIQFFLRSRELELKNFSIIFRVRVRVL